jgi:hypothetical protein
MLTWLTPTDEGLSSHVECDNGAALLLHGNVLEDEGPHSFRPVGLLLRFGIRLRLAALLAELSRHGRAGVGCVVRTANDQSSDHVHVVAVQVIDGFGGGIPAVLPVNALDILGGSPQKFQVAFQDDLDLEEKIANRGARVSPWFATLRGR